MNASEEGLFPEMQLISFLKLYPGGILPHDDLLLYVIHDAYMYDEYDNCLVDSVTCLNPCDSSKRGDQVIML